MGYSDAHCHLADPRLSGMLDGVFERASQAGIELFVQGGVDPEDWSRQKALQKKYPTRIVTSFGLHPRWVARASAPEFESAFKTLQSELPNAQALGEIGLDYGPRLQATDKGLQKEFQIRCFERQLELASQPLVLHIVRAHEDALRILSLGAPLSDGGIVHSFSGVRENARKYMNLGLSLSISGGITKNGFESLKKAIAYIPRDRLLVETDSPDQPLTPGALNEPSRLLEIARAISAVRKSETAEQILEASAENARRIFLKAK